jgi:hypothetical protein
VEKISLKKTKELYKADLSLNSKNFEVVLKINCLNVETAKKITKRLADLLEKETTLYEVYEVF